MRDLTAMERLISYTLQKVGRPRITLKSEQRECIEHMYEGKDVIVWLLASENRFFPEVLSLVASSAGVYVMVFTGYVVHVGRRLDYAHARTVRIYQPLFPPPPPPPPPPRKEPGYETNTGCTQSCFQYCILL